MFKALSRLINDDMRKPFPEDRTVSASSSASQDAFGHVNVKAPRLMFVPQSLTIVRREEVSSSYAKMAFFGT